MAATKSLTKIQTKPTVTSAHLFTLLSAHILGEVDMQAQGCQYLLNLGLVDSAGDVTEKGQAHIAQLLKLDLPKQANVWLDAQDNIISLL